MSKIISFFSLKGGVGKTTSCANLGVIYGKTNLKVLLIDFDANGNLSSNFMLGKSSDGVKRILEKPAVKTAINKDVSNNVDLISSSIDSSFMIINDWKQEYEVNMVAALDGFRKEYDLILIDLSASWNPLNKMILSHTDTILWPIACTPFALDSIAATLNAIRWIQHNTNPNLKIEGVFINMFDKRYADSMSLLTEISKTFAGSLYDTIIPQDSLISKLQHEHKTIANAAGWKPSAIAYSELAKEIIQKDQRKAKDEK